MIIEPKSSFLGFKKDTSIIMRKILANQNVLRLIYHNSEDCLTDPACQVGDEEITEMLRTKQISNVPKIWIDKEKKNYLRITFDSFTPNAENPFYRDHTVEVKIVCPFDTWDLGDFDLRPYRIAGEIDAMLDGKKFSGIGVLNFINADQDIYDDYYGGLTLRYLARRGNEDKHEDVRPIV